MRQNSIRIATMKPIAIPKMEKTKHLRNMEKRSDFFS